MNLTPHSGELEVIEQKDPSGYMVLADPKPGSIVPVSE